MYISRNVVGIRRDLVPEIVVSIRFIKLGFSYARVGKTCSLVPVNLGSTISHGVHNESSVFSEENSLYTGC